MKRFLPVHLHALLVELDDLDQTLALLASLRRDPINGIDELVPAARTVLVQYQPTVTSFAALVEAIARRDVSAAAQRSDTLIEIPVRYDGEDLAEVAQILGITPAEVIRRHTGSEYTVAFTGFAPGFGYLVGGHPSLNVPRRSTPRTRIPAGAVGLAGTFSGVYPQASPGGWQIIGTTPTAMWDIDRDVPALLQPGYRVRFVDIATTQAAVSAPQTSAESQEATGPAAGAVPMGLALQVRSAGLQTLFQDLGRHGQAGQGVSASGAMDQGACKAANRLVGNAVSAACLETVNGGLQLCSQGDNVVAVTGASGPVTITCASGAQWQVPRYAPVALADGDMIAIGEPDAGTRSYLAVRGGFAVHPVLGSCATDTLARVGPPTPAAGDLLAVRPVARGAIVAAPQEAPAGLPGLQDDVTLDVVLGPRTDWFTEDAVQLLREQRWQVTPQSNRVGIRLAGATPLARAVTGELPSEGTPTGALQVPPSGQPVLFLADHPLTGGYPVIAVVAPYHLDRAGQIPVNAWVRFNPITAFEPVTRP
ncbi:MAG: 5-oxoprolinase subunit PxpB [Comamonadaceae bacterium]|nr:MAG: 5-oxoprolinase subunit PxpB [Comamonadaceae bacterium]